MSDLTKRIKEIALCAKESFWKINGLSSGVKNRVLLRLAKVIEENIKEIISANTKDIENAKKKNLSGAMIDRLLLDEKRINNICESLHNITVLEDPVGKMVSMTKRPNGLDICKVRVPIGVISVIYESRPNVTIDSFALGFKAGNVIILRGGSESFNSNMILVECARKALLQEGIPQDVIQYIPFTEREAIVELLKLEGIIDLVIPRGGEGLIRTVVETSKIPVIKHYKGVCHIYIDSTADPSMAEKIVINAKVQRPGVCNAVEKVLFNVDFPETERIINALIEKNVEVRCDENLININPLCKRAKESDWTEEYLDLIITAKQVFSIDEAIEHINRFGSHHSDAIITKDYSNARKFLTEVDSASVYVNASTRFTDGGEFGLGAEIGISTDKLHCRGPMGLEDLTTTKYIIYGDGQIRI